MAMNTVSSPATVPTREGSSMPSIAELAAEARPGRVLSTMRFMAVSQETTPSRNILRSFSLWPAVSSWAGWA